MTQGPIRGRTSRTANIVSFTSTTHNALNPLVLSQSQSMSEFVDDDVRQKLELVRLHFIILESHCPFQGWAIVPLWDVFDPEGLTSPHVRIVRVVGPVHATNRPGTLIVPLKSPDVDACGRKRRILLQFSTSKGGIPNIRSIFVEVCGEGQGNITVQLNEVQDVVTQGDVERSGQAPR